MSSTAAPFGFQPVKRLSGAPINVAQRTIASQYNATIYQYAPVKIHTDGTVNLAAAGDRLVGVFLGCEYTDASGERHVKNHWPASTTATDIVARITMDPDIIYRCQSAGSVPLADVGNMADSGTATTGTALTGLSTVALATQSASTEAQFQIVDIDRDPGNAAGDTYTIVHVIIAEHQFRAVADSSQAF